MYKLWVFHIPTMTFVHILPNEPYEVLVEEMKRWEIASIEFNDSYKDIPM